MQCPICLSQVTMNPDWKPEKGLDPRLKQYECFCCQDFFYAIPPLKRYVEPTLPLFEEVEAGQGNP